MIYRFTVGTVKSGRTNSKLELISPLTGGAGF